MDAGVSASRAVHDDTRTLETRQRIFEQTLHGFALCLSLPADKPSAVVRECEFESAHAC
jgi:hypothetical protein